MNPIAIVGLGAILPGACCATEFWTNALASRTSLRMPREGARFNSARYLSPDPHAPDRTRVCTGGYVADAWEFDWRRFRVPPADAAMVNPMQFIALEAAAEALQSVRRLPRENTAVLLGASGLGYQKDSGLRIHKDELVEATAASPSFLALAPARRAEVLAEAIKTFEAGLKECSNDNAVGTLASVAAGRIATHFGLEGAHYAVDVDHASALAALEIAARGLTDGEWDCVITGGVSELLTPLEWIAYEKAGLLSPTAKVAPFDAHANGTLLGEGAALFVLKRLADAERDGDTIFALLTGTSVASSPQSPTPVAMTRHSALARAMRSALADAGTSPAGVQFVSCDASGIPAVDSAEFGALRAVYGEREDALAVGSAKSLVGHLRAAAGAVSLLYATLALHHRTLPPQATFRAPAGALDPRFKVPTAAAPWPALPFGAGGSGFDSPRAAVSALSQGGTSVHVVLEGAPAPSAARASTPAPSLPGNTSDTVPAPPEEAPSPRQEARSIPPRPPLQEPIAILGMGGIYADAPNLTRFWENLIAGRDAVTEVPPERFLIDRHHSEEPARRERTIGRHGSFVELPRPRPEDAIDPAAVPQLDPSHLLLLRATEQALTDVGDGDKRWNRRKVGAFVGYMPFQSKKFAADIRVNVREFTAALEPALAGASVPQAQIDAIVAEVEERFSRGRPPLSAHSLPGWLPSMMAARLGRRYGFEGPCVAVESACASTLAALHAAVQALRHGACEVALAGASFCDMPVEFFVATSRFNGLSPNGISPFDAAANGFVPGEGAGVFVLKRLVDAERDGDRIRAVLTAIGSSSDGKGGRSLLSPSVDGESLSMQRGLSSAGIDPGSVDYVECHGTATPVGDAVEGMALACAYGGAARQKPLGIGSVKSNLGHLCPAAGAPALTKVVLAIERGEIPPSIHCAKPNPKIDFTAAKAEILRERTPWPSHPDRPRRAGVSTFGIGGTNFHAIVEEYRVVRKAPWTSFWVGGEPPDSTRGVSSSLAPGQLFAFAFESAGRCLAEATACLAQFRGGTAKDFAEAARTTRAQATAGARSGAKVRLALTAFAPEDLARKIDTLGRTLASDWAADTLRGSGIFLNTSANSRPRRPLVAVFPGMGPQYPNMLRQLAGHYPLVERILARADSVWQSLTGRTLRSALWTSEDHGLAARDEDLHGGMLATSCAIAALMRFYGIRADACVGQSAGELSALVTARVLSFEDALTAMHTRTLAVLDLTIRDTGRMASVMCNADTLREIIEGIDGKIVVAADNCPTTVLASGETKAMEALSWRCAARGIEYIPFRVSHAYHSPVIAKAGARYRQVLESFAWNAPTAEVISTVDLCPYTADKREGVERLVAQYTTMVRLRELIEILYARGGRMFFEAGPRWAVTGYIRETLGKRAHIAHPSVHPKVGEVELFRRLLACAFTEGVGSLHPVRSDDTFEGPVSRADFDAASKRARNVGSVGSVGIEFSATDDLMGPPSSRPAPASKGIADDIRIVFRKSGERRQDVNAASTQDRLKDTLITALAERTGYPKQMLELDLDLEGDLGIDTVKQVEVFTKVRQQFGLPRLEGTTMRDLNTLRKVIYHFEAQLRGESPAPASTRAPPPSARGPLSTRSPRSSRSGEGDEWSAPPSILPRPLTEFVPPPPRAPTPTFGIAAVAKADASPEPREPAHAYGSSVERIGAFLVDALAERTGYPAEMLDLDLDLEGDLGIDTVKQVEVVTKVRQHFDLPRESGASLREYNTLRKLIHSLSSQLDASVLPSSLHKESVVERSVERAIDRASAGATPHWGEDSSEHPTERPASVSSPAPQALATARPSERFAEQATPTPPVAPRPADPKPTAGPGRAAFDKPRPEPTAAPSPGPRVGSPGAGESMTWAYGGPITPPSGRGSAAPAGPQGKAGPTDRVTAGPSLSPAAQGSAAQRADRARESPRWEATANLLEGSGPISVRSGANANGRSADWTARGASAKVTPIAPMPAPIAPARSLLVAGARASTLQRVVERSESRLVAEAHFSSTRDRYLSGMRLAGRPVVPISMAWEALAEAAELLDGHRVTSIVDLRSKRPLFLDERGERWVSVEATALGPGRVRVELSAAGEQEERSVYQEGIFLTGGTPELNVPRNVTSALKHRLRAGAHPLHLGETLGGAVWARALSFCEVVGGISAAEESLITDTAEPATVLSPAVLECALMLAGFGWFSLTGIAGVPVEVERILLGREPLPHEELPCHLRLRRSTGSSLTADLTVLGEGGAPVMKLTGLRLRRLEVLLSPRTDERDDDLDEVGSWDRYRVALEEALVDR